MSVPRRRVLVAGAGSVGTLAGLLLAADGHEVHALRRSADRVPAPLRPIAADLTDRASLAALDGPYDEVLVTTSADGRDVAAYRHAYVRGTATLLDHLGATQRPPRLVSFTSSTGVHGDGETVVDETTPPAPARATAEVLVEAERLLDEHELTTSVLRLSGIYGPGRTRLVDRARGGATVGPGPDWTNRVHVVDAARALVHVHGLEVVEPRWVVSDDEPARRHDVLAWLADVLGAPAVRVDHDAEPRHGKRVSNARLRASGWRPAHPNFRCGYAELLGGR